jgi:hypothetical protein
MTNDDAKYREWWERLKMEALPDHTPRELIDFIGELIVERMEQIENEAHK